MTTQIVDGSDYFEIAPRYVCRVCKKEYIDKETKKLGYVDEVDDGDLLEFTFFNPIEASDHIKQVHADDFIEVIFKGEPKAVGA